MSDQSR
jgi:drug/metabolite transporter (DMT)-like permease